MTTTGTPGAQQTQSDNEQAELRISEALDLGLQVWRTQPAVRDKFLTAQDDLGSLLARLTTAETERDELVRLLAVAREDVWNARDERQRAFDFQAAAEACIDALEVAMFDTGSGALTGRSRDELEARAEALRAAEARVEAAERERDDAVETLHEVCSTTWVTPEAIKRHVRLALEAIEAVADARAALACPPQQRGEK